MDLTGIVFGILFTVVGLLFAAGKLHPYLSAWKQMPPEEKQTIRILPLCRNIGEVILLSGIIFLMKGLCPGFQNNWFTWSLLAWLMVAGLDVYFICKSDRYKNH